MIKISLYFLAFLNTVNQSFFFPCQIVAKEEPEMFINGPKTAGAKPIVASFPISSAMPEASPEFCIPTSKAIVRHDLRSKPATLHKLYPSR